MIDITMFKEIVSETMPLDLHQKIEPHIDEICSRYERAITDEVQGKQLQWEMINERYDEIRDDFNKENEVNWKSYAKERWPEIEEYFNFSDPLAKEEKPFSRKLISSFDVNENPFSRELISKYDGEEAPF